MRARDGLLAGGFGLLAAVPTLVWAALGPTLFLDDWGYAATARYAHWHVVRLELDSRPVLSLFHGLTFLAFGDHPVPHVLTMAALNAAAGALVWLAARRLLPRRLAVLATLVWVVLPNRGSTRLWVTQAVNVLALVLVLGALLLATSERRSPARRGGALALAALGTLTYEGVGLLAVAVAVAAVWPGEGGRARVRRVGATLVLFGAIAVWMLDHSQKAGMLHPFAHVGLLPSIHFGRGVLPSLLLPLGFASLLIVVYAGWTLLSPSLSAGDEERVVAAGAGVLVLGAAPFAIVGFPMATAGLFDRANIYAGLGAAMVYAGALGLLWRARRPVLAITVAVAVVAVLAEGNVDDVRNFDRAAADGRRLLLAVDHLPADVRLRFVAGPLPNRGGVSMFVEVDEHNLGSALALRYGSGRSIPTATLASNDLELLRSPAPAYRLVGDRLVPAR